MRSAKYYNGRVLFNNQVILGKYISENTLTKKVVLVIEEIYDILIFVFVILSKATDIDINSHKNIMRLRGNKALKYY